MVNQVSSFNPTAYLNQIKGISTPTPAPVAPTAPASPTTAPASTNSSQVQLSSTILSLLQGTNSNSSAGGLLSDLLGYNSATSTSPLSGLYNSLQYTNSTTQPLQQAVLAAQQKAAQSKASNDPLQNILTSYNNSLNAYNKTALQNAQSVLAANSGSLVA